MLAVLNSLYSRTDKVILKFKVSKCSNGKKTIVKITY